MTSVIAVLVVIAVLGLTAYAGYRDGIYFSAYALMRNLFGFLCAMTFAESLARVCESVITRTYPAHGYFVLISFAAILGAVFAVGRKLKVKFTVPDVSCQPLVDKIVGPPLGFCNGVVITGTMLVFWSLVPFAKYIPGDLGDIRIKAASLDTGAAVLRLYDYERRHSMPGKAVFLLDDEPILTDEDGNLRADPGDTFDDRNHNGRWDRGWLWKYHHHGYITPEDIEPFVPPAETQ